MIEMKIKEGRDFAGGWFQQSKSLCPIPFLDDLQNNKVGLKLELPNSRQTSTP